MKRIISVSIFLFFLNSFMSLDAQWAKAYGGAGNDRAFSIKVTSDGGYILSAYTDSFGAGGYDILVLKLNSEGDLEWQNTYGGIGYERAYDIQDTNDGGYILLGFTDSFGTGNRDIWILKLNSDGGIEWQRTYGGWINDYGLVIQQTDDGGYILSGCFYIYSSGFWHSDGLILKLSSAGYVEWQYSYGGGDRDFARCIQQTDDGGYIVGGHTQSFGAGDFDIWIFKINSLGGIEWQNTYGESDFERINAIQQTVDGGYIVSGSTESFGVGGSDAWILKLNSEGAIEWHNMYGGRANDYAHFVQQTSDGGYVVAGCTYSFGKGYNDGWVIKMDSMGQNEWQKAYGGADYDCAGYIDQTNDGGYILTGYTQSFGAGDYDIWVLKIGPYGDISPLCDIISDSVAAISSTDFLPGETNIIPQDISVSQLTTNVAPLVSDLAVTLICSNQEYSLTVLTSSGGTTDPAPDTYAHYGGDRVTITGIPDDGYIFSEWTGDASGTQNPLTVIMDEDKSITANFGRGYTFFVSAGEGGTTNPAPGSYGCIEGIEVIINAIPDTGYNFGGWTGDVPLGHENDNPLTIAMDSDKSIVASFFWPCQLIITSSHGGTTDPVPGTHIYAQGTEASVSAIPEEGYEFRGWAGDASGTENPTTVNMDNDKWIISSFSSTGEKDKSFWELDCFIATAAYGSPLHPHVGVLRNFRDQYLRTNGLGRRLVDLYYRYSPFFAAVISKNRVLKVVVRVHLLPVVVFSYSMVHIGPVLTGIIGLLIFVFPVFLVRNDRRKRTHD